MRSIARIVWQNSQRDFVIEVEPGVVLPIGTELFLAPPNGDMQELRARDARTIVHAYMVADHAARSEIELYAHCSYDANGPVYDTSRYQDIGGGPADLEVISRALKYIDLRGEVWPWTLKRQIDAPHLVRFVEKETGT